MTLDPQAFLNAFFGNNPPQMTVIEGEDGVPRRIQDEDGPLLGTVANDFIVGGNAPEDMYGGGSADVVINGQTVTGANILSDGDGNTNGGADRFFVGPGISQAEIDYDKANVPDSNWNDYTASVPGGNNIIMLNEDFDGEATERVVYLQGVRDPEAMQDPEHPYYKANYTEADNKIASRGKIGDRDYQINFKNGYTVYIMNFFDDNGQPTAILQYDDCDPIEFPPVTPPPVEPPVEPPVQPPVQPPVEPPVTPPVEPPVTPPVEPPVTPPVEPPLCPTVPPNLNTNANTNNVNTNPVAISNSQVMSGGGLSGGFFGGVFGRNNNNNNGFFNSFWNSNFMSGSFFGSGPVGMSGSLIESLPTMSSPCPMQMDGGTPIPSAMPYNTGGGLTGGMTDQGIFY